MRKPPVFGLSTTPIADIKSELQREIDAFMIRYTPRRNK
jgi:hypothetical protein